MLAAQYILNPKDQEDELQQGKLCGCHNNDIVRRWGIVQRAAYRAGAAVQITF